MQIKGDKKAKGVWEQVLFAEILYGPPIVIRIHKMSYTIKTPLAFRMNDIKINWIGIQLRHKLIFIIYSSSKTVAWMDDYKLLQELNLTVWQPSKVIYLYRSFYQCHPANRRLSGLLGRQIDDTNRLAHCWQNWRCRSRNSSWKVESVIHHATSHWAWRSKRSRTEVHSLKSLHKKSTTISREHNFHIV